jgi:hypothetical protein
MNFKEFRHLSSIIGTSFLATAFGCVIGGGFIYIILPQLSKIFTSPQVAAVYHFNIYSNTLWVLVVCVLLNILIVTFVFEKIPSVSLSFIIFSLVSKAQNMFYFSYIKEQKLNTVDFMIFISMFLMLGVAGLIYGLCKRHYKTTIIEDRLRSLFSKYEIAREIENNTIKIIKEIKEPDLWGVFYKIKMDNIRGVLKGYALLLGDSKKKQDYLHEVEELNLELNAARRLVTTAILAGVAIACMVCMIFEPILVATG